MDLNEQKLEDDKIIRVTRVPSTDATEQQQKTKKSGGCLKKFFLLLLFLIVAGVACWWFLLRDTRNYSEDETWSLITHYQNTDQPDSLYDMLNYYQSQFSDGRYNTEVSTLLSRFEIERDELNSILKSNCTIKNVDTYVYAHPQGFFRTKALNILDSLEFADAQKHDTPDAYHEYLGKYPNGRFRSQAQAELAEAEADNLVTEEEKNAVAEVIKRHFQAIENNDTIDIVETVAENLSSYIGKQNSTEQDVIKYLKHTNEGKNVKKFKTSEYDISKVVTAGIPIYNVRFALNEQINPDDSLHRRVRDFKGTAIVNSKKKITALLLQ